MYHLHLHIVNVKLDNMQKTYKQDVSGYWRDINKGSLPTYPGVYFVYRCTYNYIQGTVTINQLLYIGKAEKSISGRIATHEKYDLWKSYLKPGEQLCFSCTQIDSTECGRVEAAYIFKHQPIVNTDCKNCFNYDTTTIVSNGCTERLYTNFTVYRT